MPETRALIVGDDGRHTTVGRHSLPTREEVTRAHETLTTNGTGGWLCIVTGNYWGRGKLRLSMIQELGTPRNDFATAEATFLANRAART